MTNRRKGSVFNLYRSQYLRSPAWFARRDRWFDEQRATGVPLACVCCARPGSKAELELHHVDYDRLAINGSGFSAQETHEDLLPMHPYCHELLHRLIERDAVLAYHRTRRDATYLGLEALRSTLSAVTETS
jgi:5-methylcytosine-specific restriction protein A